MKVSIARKILLILAIWLGAVTGVRAQGFSLMGPMYPIVPGETFTVGVLVNTSSYSVETYKIAISMPPGLAIPLWAESTSGVQNFNRPITHDYALTSTIEVEERHTLYHDACAYGSNLNIVNIVFLALDSAAPSNTSLNFFDVSVEEVRSCTGGDITSYFTHNYGASIPVADAVQTTTGMGQYLDLSGNSTFNENDAEIARELVLGEFGNTKDMPLKLGGLQGDINGNGLLDWYDVGWMDAITRPTEFISTGPNGMAETTPEGDDVASMSPGQTGPPYKEYILPGPNMVLETDPLEDDWYHYFERPSTVIQELLLKRPIPGKPATLVKVAPKVDPYKVRQLDIGVGLIYAPVTLAVRVEDEDGTPKVGISPVFIVTCGSGKLDTGEEQTQVANVASDSLTKNGAYPRGTSTVVFKPEYGMNCVHVIIPPNLKKGILESPSSVDFHIQADTAISDFPTSISLSGPSEGYLGDPLNLYISLAGPSGGVGGLADWIKITSDRNAAAGVDADNYNYETTNVAYIDRFETLCPTDTGSGWTVTGGSRLSCVTGTVHGRFGARVVKIVGGGTTVLQHTINMGNYTSINIGYQWGFSGNPTDGSYMRVDYSTDGGNPSTWKSLHYAAGASGLKCVWQGSNWSCPPNNGYLEPLQTALRADTAANHKSNLMIRLTFAGNSTDTFYLDNVSASGMNVIFQENFEEQTVGLYPTSFDTTDWISVGEDGICNTTANTGDIQLLQVGKGRSHQVCIEPGLGGVLETSASTDDEVSGNRINSGDNGICDTHAKGNDFQAIPYGKGKPFTTCVAAVPGRALTTIPLSSSDDVRLGEMGPNAAVVVSYGEGHSGTRFVKISRSAPYYPESPSTVTSVDPYVLQKRFFTLESYENVWLFAYTKTLGQANYYSPTGGMWSEPGQRWMCMISDNGGWSFIPIWDSTDVEETGWTLHKVCLSCDPRIKMTDNIIVKWRAVLNYPESGYSEDQDAAYVDDIMIVGTPRPPDIFAPIEDEGNGLYRTTITTFNAGQAEIFAVLMPQTIPPYPLATNPTKIVNFTMRKVDPTTTRIIPDPFSIKACESLDLMVVGRYENQPADQVSDITNLYKFVVNGPAQVTKGGHLVADCFPGGLRDIEKKINVYALPRISGLEDPGGGGGGQETGYINGKVFKTPYPFDPIQGTSIRIQGQSNFSDSSGSDGSYYRSGIPVYSSYTIKGIKSGKYLVTKTNVAVTAGQTTTANLYQTSGSDADGDGSVDSSDHDDDNDDVSDTSEPSTSCHFSVDCDEDDYPDSVDAFPRNPNEWVDTDGDTIGNNADTDDDGDSVSDYNETHATYGYVTDPLDPDSDDDGLNDYQEMITYGTNPNKADTDDGCRNDFDEITYGHNPNSAADDNHLPVVEAGATIYAINGATVYLNGRSSTHADTAPYDPVTYLWTKVAGPGSVSITNANQLLASFSTTTNGTYRFKLAITDSCGSPSDSVTVDVDDDYDSDGLSDNFETGVFDSDYTLADTDGDTITDLHEYWGETDPNTWDWTCAPGLTCFLDTSGDFAVAQDDVSAYLGAAAGIIVELPGVYPYDDLYSVLDITADGATAQDDVTYYRTLAAVGWNPAEGGIPNSVVTVPSPFGMPEIALGETTTLTVEVKCDNVAGRAGIGVVFVVDGPGELLGGRGDASVYGNPLNPDNNFPSGSRWAVGGAYTGPDNVHSYATIKVKRTGSGDITVDAIVPYYVDWDSKGMTSTLSTQFTIGSP